MDDREPHDQQYVNRRMTYEFGVVHPTHEADLLEGLCEGFVRANQVQMRAQLDAYPCCLGCGGYRYVNPESCRSFDWTRGRAIATDPNCQTVYGAWPLEKRKRGTCIDLACMLCAIMREKDDDRDARVVIDHLVDQRGEPIPGQYHAMVMKGDGEIVDPTAKVKAAETLAVGGMKPCNC